MNIYNYSQDNGEYVGTSIADKSPLEKGVYLIPAHATIKKPPAKQDGKVIIWKDNDWHLVADHRGTYYAPDGSPQKIDSIGESPQNYWTKEQPEQLKPWQIYNQNTGVVTDDLDLCKQAKKHSIEDERAAASIKNVQAKERTWQASGRSQTLLNNAITLAQAGLPLPAVWRDQNNDDMPVESIDDLLAISGAIAVQVQQAYAVSFVKKDAVDAATTIDQILQI